MGPCIIPGAVQWMARCFRLQQTVPADNTHPLFREPGVLTGFRPENKSWTHYLFSVFQVHNESVNIWSHLVGFGLIICTLYRYLTIHISVDDSHWYVVFAFGICCLIYTAISTFAHTFHSKSAFMHYTCFQFDYLGIGYFSLGFAIVTFYCSCDHHYYSTLEYYFLPANVLLSWIGFLCSSVAKLRYRRPYPFQRKLWNVCSFGSQAMCVFSLLIGRYWDCWLNDSCILSSLNHHTRVFMVAIISVFFFSSHLPERVFPGKFDIVGQGHQVFHVLVIVGTLFEFLAAYTDLQTYSTKLEIQPDISSIFTAMVIYGAVSLITMLILSPFTKSRIQQDMTVSNKCQ